MFCLGSRRIRVRNGRQLAWLQFGGRAGRTVQDTVEVGAAVYLRRVLVRVRSLIDVLSMSGSYCRVLSSGGLMRFIRKYCFGCFAEGAMWTGNGARRFVRRFWARLVFQFLNLEFYYRFNGVIYCSQFYGYLGLYIVFRVMRIELKDLRIFQYWVFLLGLERFCGFLGSVLRVFFKDGLGRWDLGFLFYFGQRGFIVFVLYWGFV